MTDAALAAATGSEGLEADLFVRLVDHLPVVLWSTDTELRLTSTRGGGLTADGLQAEGLAGKTIEEAFDDRGEAAAAVAAHRSALRGTAAIYEATFRGRVFAARVEPLTDGRGRIKGVVGFAFDVTDRRRAEAALRESETRFATAFHANPAPLVMTRLDDGRVLDANAAFLRLLDRPRADVVGRTTIALGVIEAERRAAVVRLLRDTGSAGEVALAIRRPDNTPRDVALSLVRIDLGGEPCTLGIYRDVTENKRADEQLRASRAALRSLATRQQNVREDERARIAREIHDSLGQALTAFKLDLAAARQAAARGAPEVADRLAGTARMVDDLVKGVRRIATELRPPILDALGLPAAIEWLAHDFARRTGIACRTTVRAVAGEVGADLATALFRIMQESLTNVSRHAGAAHVDVELSVSGEVVTLEVRDDGCGITEAGATGPGSLGILGMRERAAALGGVLEVGPQSAGGTRVAAWFPPGRGRPRGRTTR